MNMKIFILFSIITLAVAQRQYQKYLCFDSSATCNCENHSTNETSVNCQTLNSLRYLPTLFSRLRYQPIRLFESTKCGAKFLGNRMFKETRIKMLKFHCPFEHLRFNALTAIDLLFSVDMRHFKFKSIPQAISALQNLKILRLENGELTEIYFKDFASMTQLRVLSLKANKIKRIANNAFRSLQQIRAIDLSVNNIHTLSPSIFKNCLVLKFFNAEGNRLISMTGLLKKSMTELNLRNNNLQFRKIFNKNMTVRSLEIGGNRQEIQLQESIFPEMGFLRTILMDDCELKVLPPGLLQPARFLEDIDLSFNLLENIPDKFFHNLTKLKTVNLSRNRIVYFNNSIFEDNLHLRTVNLSNNNIKYLGDSFRYATSMKTLNLRSNNLQILKKREFSDCTSLEYLYVALNNISKIESNAFVRLKNLRFLELRGNKISSLNGSLRFVPSLREIDLQSNDFISINEYDMGNLDQLETLNLGNNPLEIVNGAFTNLKNLSDLSLLETRLTTLTKTSFPPVLKLNRLRVSSNVIYLLTDKGTFLRENQVFN